MVIHRLSGDRLNDPCAAARHAALVRAIGLDRDRAAFAELFDYYAPRIKGFLMRGGCPAEEADEMSQETMLTMWRKAAHYDPARGGVSTWLYTIARNLRIDATRRRVHESLDDTETPADCTQPGTEALAEARQRERRVHQALDHLPDEQARVVLQAFFAGQSHATLAVQLALPLGTVKSRLRIALVKLRAALLDLGE